MTIVIDSDKRAKQWRLNVSLFNNPEVVQEIREHLKNYLNQNDNGEVSTSTLLEAAKVVLRGKITAISSKLKKEQEKKQLHLERDIKNFGQEHKRANVENT